MFVWAPIPGNFTSSLVFVETLLNEAGVMVTREALLARQGRICRIALVQEEKMIEQAVQKGQREQNSVI